MSHVTVTRNLAVEKRGEEKRWGKAAVNWWFLVLEVHVLTGKGMGVYIMPN